MANAVEHFDPLVEEMLAIAEQADPTLDKRHGVSADIRNKLVPNMTRLMESEARYGLDANLGRLNRDLTEQVRSIFAARVGVLPGMLQQRFDRVVDAAQHTFTPGRVFPQTGSS